MQLTYKAQGKKLRESFCKKAATSFFNEYSLISHQINSYNDFIKNGLQKGFDSSGGIIVEPKENGDGEWR
jgi:DNA-directed RNA polymerase-4/5 subunit 2